MRGVNISYTLSGNNIAQLIADNPNTVLEQLVVSKVTIPVTVTVTERKSTHEGSKEKNIQYLIKDPNITTDTTLQNLYLETVKKNLGWVLPSFFDEDGLEKIDNFYKELSTTKNIKKGNVDVSVNMTVDYYPLIFTDDEARRGGKNTRKNKRSRGHNRHKYGRKNRGGSLRKNKISSRKKNLNKRNIYCRKNLKHSKKKNC